MIINVNLQPVLQIS